jgi:hypothetical protein
VRPASVVKLITAPSMQGNPVLCAGSIQVSGAPRGSSVDWTRWMWPFSRPCRLSVRRRSRASGRSGGHGHALRSHWLPGEVPHLYLAGCYGGCMELCLELASCWHMKPAKSMPARGGTVPAAAAAKVATRELSPYHGMQEGPVHVFCAHMLGELMVSCEGRLNKASDGHVTPRDTVGDVACLLCMLGAVSLFKVVSSSTWHASCKH